MEKDKLGTLLYSNLHIPMKIRKQPWYKERLDTKYQTFQRCTDTSSWSFIKKGMDDYRDGKVAKLDDGMLVKRPTCGGAGLLSNSSSKRQRNKKNRNRSTEKKLSIHEKYFSKILPNKERRQNSVSSLEKGIIKGPLSELGASDELPEDLIEELEDLLNPKSCSSSEHKAKSKRSSASVAPLEIPSFDSESESDDGENPSNESPLNESFVSSNNEEYIAVPEDNPLDNFRTYQRFSSKESCGSAGGSVDDDCTQCGLATAEEKESRSKTNRTSEDRVEAVTKDFCDWVKRIDGRPDNNIKEETIKELFVCAYEGGPARSVVQTMNLSRIPSELLEDANVARNTCIRRNIASRGLHHNSERSKKITYGAWYLDPKLWKARPHDEKLQPDIKQDEKPKLQAEHAQIDAVLPTLHSAHKFYQFTEESKNARKPEILRNFISTFHDGKGKIDRRESGTLPTVST